MGDYYNEVEALIGTLKNPRYATQDSPSVAPILFDGELQSTFVNFVAAQDDPHDYGVQVWNDAQAGLYGAIKPYTPFQAQPIPPPHSDDPEAPHVEPTVDTYYYRCATQVVKTIAAGEFYYQAVEALNANGRALPSGARGAAISQFAVANGMSTDDLVTFLLALDDLRFSYTAARSAYYATNSMAQFLATMKEAIEAYNAATPQRIEAP